MSKVIDISNKIEKMAPVSLKEDYDNIGIMVGDPNQSIKKVLFALDCTNEVIEEAVQNKCDMIIAHHPLFFRKPKSIVKGELLGDKVFKLIKEDIIDELTTTKYETYIPYHYFKQIPVQMLANENIEDAVINKIWDVAKTNKNLYVDQYDYGRFGGEDVPKWKMNELEWFMKLKEEVPVNVRLKYRMRFANEINDYLNSQKKLEDEKEMAL